MYCVDFADKGRSISFPPEGLVIIDYPIPKSTKFADFKREMTDVYIQLYNKRPRPIPDVSCCCVYVAFVDWLVILYVWFALLPNYVTA